MIFKNVENGNCVPKMATVGQKWQLVVKNGNCWPKWSLLPKNGHCRPKMVTAAQNGHCWPKMAILMWRSSKFLSFVAGSSVGEKLPPPLGGLQYFEGDSVQVACPRPLAGPSIDPLEPDFRMRGWVPSHQCLSLQNARLRAASPRP